MSERLERGGVESGGPLLLLGSLEATHHSGDCYVRHLPVLGRGEDLLATHQPRSFCDKISCCEREGHAELCSRLHPLGRDGPYHLLQVHLVSNHPTDFARARCRKSTFRTGQCLTGAAKQYFHLNLTAF